MSKQSSYNITGSQVNILHNTHFVSVNLKLAKSGLTLKDGILKAGSIIKKDGVTANSSSAGAEAFGIVLKDIDFTNSHGTENVSVLIHGFVDTAAITKNAAAPVAEAKSALKQIIFM